MFPASTLPTFRYAVSAIIHTRTFAKMSRINAGRIIAPMKYAISRVQFTAMKHERYPMREAMNPVYLQRSISVRPTKSLPNPTLIYARFNDGSPEPICNTAVASLVIVLRRNHQFLRLRHCSHQPRREFRPRLRLHGCRSRLAPVPTQTLGSPRFSSVSTPATGRTRCSCPFRCRN